jgi:hypothetical protein
MLDWLIDIYVRVERFVSGREAEAIIMDDKEPPSLSRHDIAPWAAESCGYRLTNPRRGIAEEATRLTLAWSRNWLTFFEDQPPSRRELRRRERTAKRYARSYVKERIAVSGFLISILVSIIIKFIVDWLFRTFRPGSHQGKRIAAMKDLGELDW